MEFREPKGIYLQIADQIRDRILRGEWSEGGRIPSIRELAGTVGVNPNTIIKSYQALMDKQIIENQRGLGYFVTSGARERILADMKSEFTREELPRLFETMRLLGVEIDDLAEHFKRDTTTRNKT
jgi:DNA-binding transcriptional regulator YhcF (GntR family)